MVTLRLCLDKTSHFDFPMCLRIDAQDQDADEEEDEEGAMPNAMINMLNTTTSRATKYGPRMRCASWSSLTAAAPPVVAAPVSPPPPPPPAAALVAGVVGAEAALRPLPLPRFVALPGVLRLDRVGEGVLAAASSSSWAADALRGERRRGGDSEGVFPSAVPPRTLAMMSPSTAGSLLVVVVSQEGVAGIACVGCGSVERERGGW